jgi:hypothetical protein
MGSRTSSREDFAACMGPLRWKVLFVDKEYITLQDSGGFESYLE